MLTRVLMSLMMRMTMMSWRRMITTRVSTMMMTRAMMTWVMMATMMDPSTKPEAVLGGRHILSVSTVQGVAVQRFTADKTASCQVSGPEPVTRLMMTPAFHVVCKQPTTAAPSKQSDAQQSAQQSVNRGLCCSLQLHAARFSSWLHPYRWLSMLTAIGLINAVVVVVLRLKCLYGLCHPVPR